VKGKQGRRAVLIIEFNFRFAGGTIRRREEGIPKPSGSYERPELARQEQTRPRQTVRRTDALIDVSVRLSLLRVACSAPVAFKGEYSRLGDKARRCSVAFDPSRSVGSSQRSSLVGRAFISRFSMPAKNRRASAPFNEDVMRNACNVTHYACSRMLKPASDASRNASECGVKSQRIFTRARILV
jgi:hypothetical protein